MKKGIRPGTEKRCELLTLCMELGMSSSMILPLVEPMEGKTDEEKEQMAEQIILELQSKSGTSTSKSNNAQSR